MLFDHLLVRLALLAALTGLPLPAMAETAAKFDPATGTILVTDASPDAPVRLSVAGQTAVRTMPLTVTQDAQGMIVTPRFSLRPGTDYTLLVGEMRFDLSVPADDANAPRVAGFAPSQAVIPANTLRLYISFTEPMARGQLLEHISLFAQDGSQVDNAFLNLEAELWDANQQRATLLLDPGRIKQGVGPNVAGDAPLQAGQSYRLVVSDRMESAAGLPMATPVTFAFRVGPAQRHRIDPFEWDVMQPRAGTLTPLSVGFDRIMDTSSARRLLSLQGPDGARVLGEISSDGGGWTIAPSRPWQAGTYRLIIDPELEDVSGNTPRAAFDAGPGTIGTEKVLTRLTLEISP